MLGQEMSRVEGDLLFEPSAERVAASRLTEFARWLGAFWSALAEFFQVHFNQPARAVLEGTMPAAHWFPGATLSYAEHALRAPDATPALVFRAEDGRRAEWSFGELKEQVARARA